MRYYVLYPQSENVHLIKDVGMIAYKLYKNYNFDSYVVCYNNDDYFYLEKEVKGLKMEFIKKRYNNDILDGLRYLRKNSGNIDVLQIFHITLRSVFYAITHKFFNPKGKVFLKLDCSDKLVSAIAKLSPLKKRFLNLFLDKVDIIGVEQERLYFKLKEMLQTQEDKFLLIPNGIDYESTEKYNEINFQEKENIILNVSRIGSYEKGSEILLEAFAKIENIEIKGWRLVLVGPVDQEFDIFLKKYFETYPRLKEKVIFKGPIYDRQSLFDEYKKAKIFCLSSIYESFGIALLEAASFGDVIVSTDVGIAKEITSFKNGDVVEVNNVEELSRSLNKFIEHKNLDILSEKTIQVCKNNYNWNDIVGKLHRAIIKKEF